MARCLLCFVGFPISAAPPFYGAMQSCMSVVISQGETALSATHSRFLLYVVCFSTSHHGEARTEIFFCERHQPSGPLQSSFEFLSFFVCFALFLFSHAVNRSTLFQLTLVSFCFGVASHNEHETAFTLPQRPVHDASACRRAPPR